MKFDIDTRFEGGPFHGNSFIVDAETDIYKFASNSATHSSQHIYNRKGDIFVYDRTETEHDSTEQ